MELKKFWNKIGIYLVLAVVIFLIPVVLESYYRNSYNDLYHKQSLEGLEMCLKRAARHEFAEEICYQINSQVTHSQRFASISSSPITSFMPVIVYLLCASIIVLKRKVDTLEEKFSA